MVIVYYMSVSGEGGGGGGLEAKLHMWGCSEIFIIESTTTTCNLHI